MLGGKNGGQRMGFVLISWPSCPLGERLEQAAFLGAGGSTGRGRLPQVLPVLLPRPAPLLSAGTVAERSGFLRRGQAFSLAQTAWGASRSAWQDSRHQLQQA